MSWVHKEFQLNNRSFSTTSELLAYSKNISETLYKFLSDWFSTEDVVIVKTSGSTGTPKFIPLKKEHMKNSALATGTFFGVQETTKALCCLPVEYIAGKMMVVRALVLGWHLDVVEVSSNPLANINQQYDFSAMVPLQLSNSLDKLELIDKLIVGGGVVSHQLEEAIQEVATKIYATYGMTETITHIATKKLNCHSKLVSESYYQILPNISITQDKRNCLVINAPKVSDELVVTNDIVEIISENEFQWKGRFDNVINSGGVKLHPEEIEKKLAPYISNRFFVAGFPDEQLGEKLVLIIEGDEKSVILNSRPESVEVLFQNMKNVLSKFELPKTTFFIPKFEETPTGKIQRKRILQKMNF